MSVLSEFSRGSSAIGSSVEEEAVEYDEDDEDEEEVKEETLSRNARESTVAAPARSSPESAGR